LALSALAVSSIPFFSLIGWLFPSATAWLVVVALVLVTMATIARIEWGIAIVFGELMIGSFGHWLTVSERVGSASVRMLLFAAFLVSTAAVYMLRPKQRAWSSSVIKPWVIIAILMSLYGVARGFARAIPVDDLIDDSNQWLFLAIILPLGLCERERLGRILVVLWPAASIALFVLGAALLYTFTHDEGLNIAMAIYRWTRDTLIAEVTVITPSVVRVFAQSQIIVIPVFWALLHARTRSAWHWAVLTMTAAVLIMSLSRSFIVGLAGVLLLALLALPERRRIAGNVALSVGLGVAVLFMIARFPFPHPGVGSITQGFVQRSTLDDPASRTRWALLPPLWEGVRQHWILGSGTGASIEYKSQDPRVLQQQPEGLFRTHAFEWGVLDLWFKFGLLGLVFYGSILWQSLWYARHRRPVAALSILTVALIHVFTPYLNHPIGLAMLFGIDQLSTDRDLFQGI
ncbi:O-antigen ligase family protein, partial [Candidatus Uhrbacteria bacterium]|nr:O-antigen ligase family protein [Candidatus Uhrbacteria bacterium]